VTRRCQRPLPTTFFPPRIVRNREARPNSALARARMGMNNVKTPLYVLVGCRASRPVLGPPRGHSGFLAGLARLRLLRPTIRLTDTDAAASLSPRTFIRSTSAPARTVSPVNALRAFLTCRSTLSPEQHRRISAFRCHSPHTPYHRVARTPNTRSLFRRFPHQAPCGSPVPKSHLWPVVLNRMKHTTTGQPTFPHEETDSCHAPSPAPAEIPARPTKVLSAHPPPSRKPNCAHAGPVLHAVAAASHIRRRKKRTRNA